jgi:hypothetical protein
LSQNTNELYVDFAGFKNSESIFDVTCPDIVRGEFKIVNGKVNDEQMVLKILESCLPQGVLTLTIEEQLKDITSSFTAQRKYGYRWREGVWELLNLDDE